MSCSHQILFNDSTAALATGWAGLGILSAYMFLVKARLESGALVAACPEWEGERIPAHIAFFENRHVESTVRVFMEWIRELCSRYR
nr:LysR substrate-binding domain-containing protein [Pseudomonas sp. LP_7_YM]